MKEYNIILANALIKNSNRGCVALSVTTLYLLDSIASEYGFKCNFFLTDSLLKPGFEYSYNVMDKELKFKAVQYPCALSTKGNVKLFVKKMFNRQLSSVFRNADFIFDIGQGDSFSDIYGGFRFKQIDRIHEVARSFKKKYCLLPQTIGPFENPEIKKKAALSLTEAALVMTRDKQSYEYVKSLAPDQYNLKEYIDVAFYMPYKTIRQNADYIHVGINISSLLWHGGYTRNNQFGLNVDYKRLVFDVIDYFLKKSNVKVHLIPHVVSAVRGVENDYEVSYEVWRSYENENLILAPFALDPIEIKNYIAGMDFFLGARMHATIAAFSTGVPVLPMAYSRKFNGLFIDTLRYPYVADMKTQKCDEIMELVTNSFDRSNELRKLVDERNETIVKEKKKMLLDDLKQFLNL